MSRNLDNVDRVIRVIIDFVVFSFSIVVPDGFARWDLLLSQLELSAIAHFIKYSVYQSVP